MDGETSESPASLRQEREGERKTVHVCHGYHCILESCSLPNAPYHHAASITTLVFIAQHHVAIRPIIIWCSPLHKIIIIYCWLIAQSTAQGHLRAFHKYKEAEEIHYYTSAYKLRPTLGFQCLTLIAFLLE